MTVAEPISASSSPATSPSIKCVIWDLDNTIWDGVLLESEQVTLRSGIVEIIQTLDSRGILHSIASKNDHATAMAKLEQFGLSEYFLYPQINWNSKASSVEAVAKAINIGIDTLAFIDDQPFEREEVAFALPNVRCIDAFDLTELLDRPDLNPRFITEDSRLRRVMYQSTIKRDQAEQAFIGPSEEFLATLEMNFTISTAQEDDLQRAEELTVRTHQLNTTGYTYSYDELDAFRRSDQHLLLTAGLDDKYGTYGKIGLALVECRPDVWTLKLLLMSCRVMSRGVGTIMINHILSRAKAAGVRFQAEFISNNRNRMMYVTYKFGGFNEREKHGDLVIFEHDMTNLQPFPAYVQVTINE